MKFINKLKFRIMLFGIMTVIRGKDAVPSVAAAPRDNKMRVLV